MAGCDVDLWSYIQCLLPELPYIYMLVVQFLQAVWYSCAAVSVIAHAVDKVRLLSSAFS